MEYVDTPSKKFAGDSGCIVDGPATPVQKIIKDQASFTLGPKRTVEHVFIRRCGFPEAAVHGVVQKNPEPSIAGGRSMSTNLGAPHKGVVATAFFRVAKTGLSFCFSSGSCMSG